jgi:hypothetical protein
MPFPLFLYDAPMPIANYAELRAPSRTPE